MNYCLNTFFRQNKVFEETLKKINSYLTFVFVALAKNKESPMDSLFDTILHLKVPTRQTNFTTALLNFDTFTFV